MHKRLIRQDNPGVSGLASDADGAWPIAPGADPAPHVQWLRSLVARDEGFRRFLAGALAEQAAARRDDPRT
jgi:hypothetical protein